MTRDVPTFGAYTDYGELRAVIVGSAEGLALPPYNPTLSFYNDELSEAETRAYATVGVSLDDRRYIIPAGLDRVAEELAKRGVEPIEIQYDQVSYWGGCVSCSTHAISREPC